MYSSNGPDVWRDILILEIHQCLQKWHVGVRESFLEDVAKVADWLVIMNAQTQVLDITPPNAAVHNRGQEASVRSLPGQGWLPSKRPPLDTRTAKVMRSPR